jgi:transaldolase
LQGRLLHQYIAELTVTGLTSNPTIFDHASIEKANPVFRDDNGVVTRSGVHLNISERFYAVLEIKRILGENIERPPGHGKQNWRGT